MCARHLQVEQTGFALKAFGFFHRGNDSVDIPHKPNVASTCCGGASANGIPAANGVAANGHRANGAVAANGSASN